jgi:DNA-binding XRE family transcriptional regulator
MGLFHLLMTSTTIAAAGVRGPLGGCVNVGVGLRGFGWWPIGVGGCGSTVVGMDAEEARMIGQRVLRIRKARGKTQEVIAGLAGISPPTLSRIENGKHPLDSLSQLVGLANALGIPPRN